MPEKTHIIDASGKSLGRLAAEIAILLRGKNKPNFSPNINNEDKVIVINVAKLKPLGKKAELKKYYRHSGYLGGIKEITYKELFSQNPSIVLKKAVYGMLPRNKLRAKMIKNLILFNEGQHGTN